jgi:hypothetical protein
MHTLCDAQVSLFRGATDAQPVRTVPISTVLTAIQTGAYRQPIGYPLKAGQFMTSSPEPNIAFALPRSGQHGHVG